MSEGGQWLQHEALLDELAESQRDANRAQARQQRVLHALANDPLPLPNAAEAQKKKWVREEIACELNLSPSSAGWRMNTAVTMVEQFEPALQLVEAGKLTMRYLWILHDSTRHLTDDQSRQVLARVIDHAPDQSPPNFQRSVKRAVLAIAPKTADEQREDALADRRVTGRRGEHGTSTVFAELPTEAQEAILTAVDELARRWAAVEGETRTMDQLRADAFVQLTLGDVKPKVTVNVCVALSTLTGADEQPGELNGQPITANHARLLAEDPNSTWRRLVTDPVGRLVDYGRTRYRPPTALAEFVRARDRECTFPHCNRPAEKCDLDHRVDWAKGGETNEHDLHPLCERNHIGKHEAGWKVTIDNHGTSHWVSPIGRRFENPRPTYPIDTTTDGDRSAPEDH